MSGPKWTQGPWRAVNMVHAERGDQMTPDEIAEYVLNSVKAGSADHFLAVKVDKDDGPADVCLVGNGPDGIYNARLIETAGRLYWALEDLVEQVQQIQNGAASSISLTDAQAALKKARGDS